MVMIVVPGIACRPAAAPTPPSTAPVLTATDFRSLLNAARGHYLGRRQDQAIASLRLALAIEPKSFEARFDLALASIATDVASPSNDKIAEAVLLLNALLKEQPEHAAANYLAGVSRNLLGRGAEAAPLLAKVADRGSPPAVVLYQYGVALRSARQYVAAAEQFEKATRIDRFLAPAFYERGMALRMTQGVADPQVKAALEEFQKLNAARTKAGLGSPNVIHCAYTRFMEPPPAAPIPPTAPLKFTEATADFGFASAPAPDSSWRVPVCLLPREAGEPPDLLACGTQAVYRIGKDHRPTKLFDAPASQPATPANWLIMIAADVLHSTADHDSRMELLLIGDRSARLLSIPPAGAAIEVDAHLPECAANACKALWVDFDQDGDLDLLLIDQDYRPRLLANDGNARFADVSDRLPWEKNRKAFDAAAVDFDRDDLIDLLFTCAEAPSVVLRGTGLGAFAPLFATGDPWPLAGHCTVDDLDNDGRPDWILATGETLTACTADGLRREVARVDAPLRFGAPVACDLDNDGLLDLVADTVDLKSDHEKPRTSLLMLRNRGSGTWEKATPESVAELHGAQGALMLFGPAADFDGDGDTDLLLGDGAAPRILRNDAPAAHHALRLQLAGTRSNRNGIGAMVNIRDGEFRATRFVQSTPVTLGVGPRDRLAEVDVMWTNGVTDSVLDVDLSRPLVMKETLTAVGSCPYLYAWDGTAMRFITDILGASPLGLPLRRGRMVAADTDELVWIGTSEQVRPQTPGEGRYLLSITDEMREIIYLDQVALWAVDHPAGVIAVSNDALRPPPFAPSAIHLFRNARPPLRAALTPADQDDGSDLSSRLAREDDQRVGPPRLRPPQLRGLAEPHTLTLEFGLLDDVSRPALLLTGWIQWGDAGINVAASDRADLPDPSPRLEVEDASGEWRPVDIVCGLPAGKTKRIFWDLSGRLPRGARRLRITHGFELFWDCILLAENLGATSTAASPIGTLAKLAPISARLSERGFSRMGRERPDQPIAPNYAEVSPGRKWPRTPSGWATRAGDVRTLLESTDDRYVVMTGGDEVRLEFDPAALPPLNRGWVRDLILYSDGWDKDADPHVVAGATIEPLPLHGEDAESYGRSTRLTEDWMRDSLTRWIDADVP